MNLDKIKNLVEAEKCRRSLLYFTKKFFKLRFGFDFIENYHHLAICQALERVYNGDCKRLIINIPPRFGKTELAVINFAAWCFAKNADCEFIYASYTKELSRKASSLARDMMMQPAYMQYFNINLKNDSTAKDHWKTSADGVFYAVGSGGTITGFGAGKQRDGFGGAIIIDDPHKPEDIRSTLMRKNVLDWFSNTLESRKNNKDTPIIVIMQRLHEEDLSGWLLNGGNGEKWEHLCIPALNDAGEAMWAHKLPLEELERMRLANPYVFAGQYQQTPVPAEGGLFKAKDIQYYDVLPTDFERLDEVVISWDFAFKETDTSDFVAGQVWARHGGNYYFIDGIRKRLTVQQSIDELLRLYENHKHNPKAHTIAEDKANGAAIKQLLRDYHSMKMINPIGGKGDRAIAVTHLFETGNVYFKRGHVILKDFINELLLFSLDKRNAHDDQVDAMTQALQYLKMRQGGSRIMIGTY